MLYMTVFIFDADTQEATNLFDRYLTVPPLIQWRRLEHLSYSTFLWRYQSIVIDG